MSTRLSFITALLFLPAAYAYAAEPPQTPPNLSFAPHATWQGFYVAANIGYADTSNQFRLLPKGRWLEDTEAPFLAAQGSPSLRSGGIGGGTGVGFNYQLSRVIAGIEADFSWTDLSTRRVSGPFPPYEGTGDVYSFASAAKSQWLSTARGRLGLLVDDRTLVYFTGGLALADFTAINGYGNDLGPGLVNVYTPLRSAGTSKTVNIGWTVGAGIEYAFDERVKVRVEYLYADLGYGKSFTRGETLLAAPVANGFFVTNRASLVENIGRIGLSVMFP
jgi:outer membrane immunogenic protein